MVMNKTELFDAKLRFQIPEGFKQVPDEEIAHYYPAKQPDILFENKENGALIAVAKLENELAADALEARIQEYAAVYQRSVPNFANCKIGKRTLPNGKQLGMFYYTSTTAQRDLLNYVVLSSLDGKEIMLTLHCNCKDCPAYAEKLMRTINSVEIHDAG